MAPTHTKTAIAFQGGGALGAFALGALQRIYEMEPGFQPSCVSGVSIGAFTAAIVEPARFDANSNGPTRQGHMRHTCRTCLAILLVRRCRLPCGQTKQRRLPYLSEPSMGCRVRGRHARADARLGFELTCASRGPDHDDHPNRRHHRDRRNPCHDRDRDREPAAGSD
jgi:hypothetical protein